MLEALLIYIGAAALVALVAWLLGTLCLFDQDRRETGIDMFARLFKDSSARRRARLHDEGRHGR